VTARRGSRPRHTRVSPACAVSVAGQLNRHLREGGLVEHLHDAHAHRVERLPELPAGDVGGDVVADRVGLEEGEESALDGEVARVAERAMNIGTARIRASAGRYARANGRFGARRPA
jgi:hypothetical protein